MFALSHFAVIAALSCAAPCAFAAPTYLITPAELAQRANQAPAALTAKIETVVDKTIKTPSGDPHDYVSFARYYWPDPTKPDGLPYVSRDGQHNREQVARGDRLRIGKFCETVEALAAAWHVHRDEAAARRAGDWLRAWFIDPATRMNPHLDYAQVRLGRNNNFGNAAGVLDSRDFAKVIDALIVLDNSPALSAADKAAIRAWFTQFLHWLETAPNALIERRAKNNHGTWYFAQAIPIARYVGRDEFARQLVEEDKALIAHQLRADGSQPEEIRRVDGLGYSVFNLEAHAVVARLAAGLGVDLWSYTAPNGANLRRGVEFLRPYNAAPDKWPHSQNEKLAPGFLDQLLRESGLASAGPHAPTPAPAPTPTAPPPAKKAAAPEVAPQAHEGAETFIYRDSAPEPVRLFVTKPKGWKASDRRPAFMFFFGGGWTTGTTKNSIGWAKWATEQGMVGITPDYRTKNRFGTSPLASVADSRAALRWVQDHAAELGIDPTKVIVGGNSAGGHVALWTGITASPPGSSAAEAPTAKPAALVLFSTVSDTSALSGYTPSRFGENATALSPVHQLDARMPPVLAFHGDADPTVPVTQAYALRDKLLASGNTCDLVIVPGGNHNFSGQFPAWREKSRELLEAFLRQRGLLP